MRQTDGKIGIVAPPSTEHHRRGYELANAGAALLAVLALLAAPALAQPPARISLQQAIQMAIEHSPSIQAAITQIEQSKDLEVTANLRPNPTLSADSLLIPTFTPRLFSADTVNDLQQFDVGVAYLFERGKKRQHRLEAARDQTRVTEAQIDDIKRGLAFAVAQQFVNVLLAESTLQFTAESLEGFQKTVAINEDRFKAGDLSKSDFLKIEVQLLQFQTDVNSAKLAKVQALASLRQLIGYEQLASDYDVEGELAYLPVQGGLEDMQAQALRQRPDYRAAQLGITAAESQVGLARANGKQDVTAGLTFTHVNDATTNSFNFSIPLPVFNRNQGEIARTKAALTQAQFTSTAAHDTVLTDVRNAFEALKSNETIVTLYQGGYLQQSLESRDISEFAYRQGAAALLDYLDAERSYRSTQLAYRQALANYMLAAEQLHLAVGAPSTP